MNKPKNNLVWIASYPKSGNTWFRIFIQNLISQSEESIDINNLSSSHIATNRKLFDEYLCIQSSDLTFEEIDLLRPVAYEEYSSESDKLLFIKVHDRWSLNIQGDPIFPSHLTKGVIYLIRNPFDVAVSLAYHNSIDLNSAIKDLNDSNRSYSSSDTKLSSQLKHHISSWSDHIESWTKESNLPLCLLRYEDMKSNPVESFLKAVTFLGLDYSKTQVTKAIENSDFGLLKSQEQEFGFKEKPLKADSFFRTGLVGNWKKHLSEKMKNDILKCHRKTIEKYGYQTE